jgi:hypothetical protein
MDIIADVMAKADPAARQAALLRLEKLSRTKTASVDQATFTPVMAGKDQSRLDGQPTATKPEAAQKDVMRKLDAVLATKLVESMMPRDQSSLYGEGTSGEVWWGLHMEVLGKALADDGILNTSSDAPQALPALGLRKAITPFSG